ncbi:MAG: DUF4838 domain-containing protein [Oscillospiraceae bacterium]|nr:DUF4838 domain-containing protein [Oscillospiraceae bacterium]
MEWKIEKVGESRPIAFAAEELCKYLCKMDPEISVSILKSGKTEKLGGTVKLSADPSHEKLPQVDDASADDAYHISICGQNGEIIGSNERSVLLGVYRLLSELGCRWLRPGKNGEIIPKRSLENIDLSCADSASYRHRGVCIEGAVSFSHVADMIDWLPKLGMNAYFTQFVTPYAFYDRWYNNPNPYIAPNPVSAETVRAGTAAHAEQIKKRGMMYHSVGHGWTCAPLGIEGTGWESKDHGILPEAREMLAMIGGKRDFFHGVALNTNLCYSNPEVREKIAWAIADYCKNRPEVDYLHFWLADGANNHCECENCKDAPSDYYVQMLNRIDELLFANSSATKIVFLIYVDLLWEPQKQRLQNPDRFVLMFAPITRTYSNSFVDSGENGETREKLAPYERNRLVMPSKVGENIRRLSKWQEQFSGDSFDFDYHLMWDHEYDLGGFHTARILFDDMKNLEKLQLNGMMSCQLQRVFFPTGLAMYAMGSALWDKTKSFEGVAAGYYADALGDRGAQMQEYLKTLTELCDTSYLRGEKPAISEESAKKFARIPGTVNAMMPSILRAAQSDCEPCRKKLWEALAIHGQLCLYMAEILEETAKGNIEKLDARWENVKDFLYRAEPFVHEMFDAQFYINVIGGMLERKRNEIAKILNPKGE